LDARGDLQVRRRARGSAAPSPAAATPAPSSDTDLLGWFGDRRVSRLPGTAASAASTTRAGRTRRARLLSSSDTGGALAPPVSDTEVRHG